MKSYLCRRFGMLATILFAPVPSVAQEANTAVDSIVSSDSIERFVRLQSDDPRSIPTLNILPESYFQRLDEIAHRLDQQMDKTQAVYLAQADARAKLQLQSVIFEKQQQNKTAELAHIRQQSLHNMLMLGSLVSALLLLFLCWSRYNQYRLNKQLALEIKQQTSELLQKNEQLEAANRALEKVSMRDALTGLYNRNFLNAQLAAEVARTQHHYATVSRNDYQPNNDLLCFLIDIDFFKHINDEFGHLAGDRFLVQFTAILKEQFRQTDLLIRWGGEEFLVICRYADRNEAVELANRLTEAVRQKRFYLPNNSFLHATCSIGFCALPLCRHAPYSVDWQQTFAIMDYCLYAAKISQRDCWVGVTEADGKHKPANDGTCLEAKFGIQGSEVRTSLNNLASITWPDE